MSNRTRNIRRVLVTSALAIAGVLATATPALAATGTVQTSGIELNVRAAPNIQAAAIGTIANGSTITLTCQATGQSITGTFPATTLWDYVPAKGGFVSDAYVNTGTTGRVAPDCTDPGVTSQCATGGCPGQAVFNTADHKVTVYENKADGLSAVAQYWLNDGTGPFTVWNSNGNGTNVVATIPLPVNGWIFYKACLGEGGPKVITTSTCSAGITGYA